MPDSRRCDDDAGRLSQWFEKFWWWDSLTPLESREQYFSAQVQRSGKFHSILFHSVPLRRLQERWSGVGWCAPLPNQGQGESSQAPRCHHDAPRKLGGAHGDNGYQATSGYWYHVPGQCFACCTEETHVNDHWRKLWPAQRSVYIISKCSPCRGHGCWCLQHNISVGSSWVHAGVNVWPCGCSQGLNEGARSEAVWANCGYTAATLLHLCIDERMLFAMKASEILCTPGLGGGQHEFLYFELQDKHLHIYIDRYIYILYIYIYDYIYIWLYIYDYYIYIWLYIYDYICM